MAKQDQTILIVIVGLVGSCFLASIGVGLFIYLNPNAKAWFKRTFGLGDTENKDPGTDTANTNVIAPIPGGGGNPATAPVLCATPIGKCSKFSHPSLTQQVITRIESKLKDATKGTATYVPNAINKIEVKKCPCPTSDQTTDSLVLQLYGSIPQSGGKPPKNYLQGYQCYATSTGELVSNCRVGCPVPNWPSMDGAKCITSRTITNNTNPTWYTVDNDYPTFRDYKDLGWTLATTPCKCNTVNYNVTAKNQNPNARVRTKCFNYHTLTNNLGRVAVECIPPPSP